MRQGISNIEVKRLNRNRVFRYVNQTEKVSMPDIAAALGMSAPTVLQIIKELKELGFVKEAGEFRSTGGRKAKAIASVQDNCYAIGVDITRNHVSLVLTNLSERVLKHNRIRKPFVKEEHYLAELNDMVEAFAADSEVEKEKIIGVGITVPGIIDMAGHRISDSHALGLHDVALDKYRKFINYPCVVLNDANAAAMTEHIGSSSPQNMVYLSLSNSVGGGIVFQKEAMFMNDSDDNTVGIFKNMYAGNKWRSGEFGHMAIHPGGPNCYCGKSGCLDVYCSSLRLTGYTKGDLERFFLEVEAGNARYEKVWEEYLNNLVIAVDNLSMSFDCSIVLGGYVGSYMEPYIDRFREKIAKIDIFGSMGEYVRVCKYKVEASALGAALFQIEKYIDSI